MASAGGYGEHVGDPEGRIVVPACRAEPMTAHRAVTGLPFGLSAMSGRALEMPFTRMKRFAARGSRGELV